MNKAEIALEILVIDQMIEDLVKIRDKAQLSSPTSRMLWLQSNNVSQPIGGFPSIEDRRVWESTEDGIKFTNSIEDIKKLRQYRYQLMATPVEELSKKLGLKEV